MVRRRFTLVRYILKNKSIAMDLFPASVTERTVEVYSARISAKSKIIYLIIILSIILALVSLPLVYTDITIQARGLFQSPIERQSVTAPIHGRVTRTYMKQGVSVAVGDTLLVIGSEGLEARAAYLGLSIRENDLFISDLERLKDKCPLSLAGSGLIVTPRYNAELNSFLANLELQELKYQRAGAEYKRCSILYIQDIVPVAEYEKLLREYRLEEAALRQVAVARISGWQSELSMLAEQQRHLRAELGQLKDELSNRVITSPVQGTIIQSTDIQPGSYVTPGQPLAEISPYGSLLAVFYVTPADIGFISQGQSVRLQVDAFNYHQWGMLDGVITGISGDIITGGNTALYRVNCLPHSTTLESAGGSVAEVGKGMTFTARVIVNRRSLFNLLWDKADSWLNPYNGKKKDYAGTG